MPLSSFVAAVRPPADPGGRPYWRRAGYRAWRITLWLMLAAWLLILAAWLTLQWWILPRLDDWRPRVEAQASRALGHPVAIGQISVRSSGWVPAFALRDVVLRDAQGREALRLPLVSAALSVPSLLGLQIRFRQLLIDAPRLEVRRDAQGRLSVGGLALDGAASGTEGAVDWICEQQEFVIRGGALRWVDDQRAAPPLQLDDLQLVLRNRGRRHELRLDATPPAGWGERFTISGQARGTLLARAGDWRHWTGTLYADLPRADLSQLRRHVDLPVDVQQGVAALRAWIDWDRGRAKSLTLDAALREVSVRLASGLEPVALAELSGRFVAERDAAGVRLSVQRLSFVTAAGESWAPSALRLQWQQAQAPAGAAVTGGQLSADRLDLATLAGLGERLPIGAGLNALLAQLEPRGTVRALEARWEGQLDAPRRYSARAQVQGLAIAASPPPEAGGIGRPGWRGADLQFDATETGGHAELSLHDGAIELPGVFEEAVLPLKRFSTRLQWRIAAAAQAGGRDTAPPAIELKLLDTRFDSDDARGTLSATWRSGTGRGFGKGGRLPGVLELDGRLAEGQAARVARYLPLGISADVRSWTRRAVLGGLLRDVSFRVKGDLWDFPFVNRREGEFRIAGQLQDVALAPVPAAAGTEARWPAFTAIAGGLVFERNSMSFQQLHGRLWGLELSQVQGRIRTLTDKALLEVEGHVRGPASDLLRYVRSTPLAEWSGGVVDATTVGGPTELQLALNLPLTHPADTAVKAGLQLSGNDIRLRPDLPLFAAARGRIDITHRGVQLSALRGQLLGGEAQIDGGSQPDGSLRFNVAGSASAEALRRMADPGAAGALAARLSGQATYRLQWGQVRGQTGWLLTSPLSGLAVDLPEPLRKSADATWPLRLASTPEPAAGAPTRRSLRLSLGPLKAVAVLDDAPAAPAAGAASSAARLLRSAWSWDAPLPEPVAGGRAVLVVPQLDVDAWRQVWDMPAPPRTAARAPAAATAPDSDWLPRSVQLRSADLRFSGRHVTGLTLDLQRLAVAGDAGWRAQVQADQASGSAEYREPRQPGAEARIKARLSRLALPAADAVTGADPVADLLDRAPTSVPALDIEIDDFESGGHRLGKLAVVATNRAGGGDETGPRNEWRLERLQLVNPDARFDASGSWQAVAGQPRRRMALDFGLEIGDGGALLERLGFGRVVRGAKGRMTGKLSWDGSPLGLDLPTLDGSLGLALEGGQFLKVDPGAARLLGVLSLQALPRRLSLDFRDVFEKGFAFDNAIGDVRIARGVASTQNLRLRGPQALVLMEGSVDIVHERQDLHVVVVPDLSAGSAALAYAAINPAIGLGAFVGQWLLRDPLRQASAREFRISGGWTDPQVERMSRKLFDPLPAAAMSDAPESGPEPAASMPGATPAQSASTPTTAPASAASSAPAADRSTRPEVPR